MSRKGSASNLDQIPERKPSSHTGPTLSDPASVRSLQNLPTSTGSVGSSKRSAASTKGQGVGQPPSRTTSVIWQSWPEEPPKPSPIASLSPPLQGFKLDPTPLPKAIVPKILTAHHRAHIVKKYRSTRPSSGRYGVRSGLKVLQGAPATNVIHARVYLFYKRQLFPDEYIVDLADPEKNLGLYGFFQADFNRLFEAHFGVSHGRARVLYQERLMPEPWMDVHIDVEITKQMQNGKEQMQGFALGLWKPVVLNSSKLEELKRTGGKCGAWIEEAKRNERRREAEKYGK